MQVKHFIEKEHFRIKISLIKTLRCIAFFLQHSFRNSFFYTMLINCRQVALHMKQHRDKLHEEELAFYRDQEVMVKAEEERRHLITKEDEKLNEQRKK